MPVQATEEAAKVIYRWIDAERGARKETRPPGFFKVEHGRKSWARGWDAAAPKFVEFELAATAGGVHGKVTVYPAFGYVDDVRAREKLARQHDAVALSSLWGLYSPALPRQALAHPVLVPPWSNQLADPERPVEKGRAAVAVGAVLALLGWALVLSGSVRAGAVDHAIILIPGHLILLYGARWLPAGLEQRKRARAGLRAPGAQPSDGQLVDGVGPRR